MGVSGLEVGSWLTYSFTVPLGADVEAIIEASFPFEELIKEDWPTFPVLL